MFTYFITNEFTASNHKKRDKNLNINRMEVTSRLIFTVIPIIGTIKKSYNEWINEQNLNI